jgi:hypothetical protein
VAGARRLYLAHPALVSNYCCRDDYGTRYDQVSAWAGLHYYCSRWGQAANAGNGAWLTWPGGMQPVATAMEQASVSNACGHGGFLTTTSNGVEALCLELVDGPAAHLPGQGAQGHLRHALYVAARVVRISPTMVSTSNAIRPRMRRGW